MNHEPTQSAGAPGFATAMRLASWRLGSSRSWTVALVLATLAGLTFALAAAYLGIRHQGAYLTGVPARCAQIVGWLSTLIIGWWASGNRAEQDAKDGIAAIAVCRGLPREWLASSRAIACSLRLAALVFAATLPCAIASAIAAPEVHLAVLRALAIALLALFSLLMGLIGGALATACGELAPRRGRSLLAALVFVPWALEGVWLPAHAGVGSLPSLMGAIADLIAKVGA